MRVEMNKQVVFPDTKKIKIYIDETEYNISQSIDGRLVINKVYGTGGNDSIAIFPRYTNEVEIL